VALNIKVVLFDYSRASNLPGSAPRVREFQKMTLNFKVKKKKVLFKVHEGKLNF